MLVISQVIFVKASMLTIKDTDVAETAITGRTALTALIMMITGGLMMMMMADITDHLMMTQVTDHHYLMIMMMRLVQV